MFYCTGHGSDNHSKLLRCIIYYGRKKISSLSPWNIGNLAMANTLAYFVTNKKKFYNIGTLFSFNVWINWMFYPILLGPILQIFFQKSLVLGMIS